jgi:hypothetical protein
LDSEGHVRGDYILAGIGMLGSIAKEAIHFVHRVEGGRGLKGGKVASGCKHEGIDGSGAAEEGADDGLEEPAVGGGGEGGGICWGYLRGGRAEDGGGVDHGGVAQAEFDRLGDGGFEELGNTPVKGEARDAGLSVSVNVKAEAPSANRGGGDFVEEFKGGLEVVVVGQGGAFYAEIVNSKGEGNAAVGMAKQRGSGGLVTTAR